MDANVLYGENFSAERERQEYTKYGRRLHEEAAAHPHIYEKHSIPASYGHFDRPINEPNQ